MPNFEWHKGTQKRVKTKILQENVQKILNIQVETTNIHVVSQMLHTTNIWSFVSITAKHCFLFRGSPKQKTVRKQTGSIPGHKATCLVHRCLLHVNILTKSGLLRAFWPKRPKWRRRKNERNQVICFNQDMFYYVIRYSKLSNTLKFRNLI
jgi:hypothetical protein